MPEIVIRVRHKIATASVRQIVCDNTDYTVRLDLDGDWTAGAKTVLFVLQGVGVLAPGVTTDDVCDMPAIHLSDGVGRQLAVGVQQGAVKTTTAASIWCYPSAESAMLNAIVEDENVSKTWLEWVNENMAQAEINVETAERVLEEAQGAADDAATAKADAEAARDDARAAQTAAETAQTGAETAQTAAETAQTGAEAAKTAAETAQTSAEAARDTAITARDTAVTAKNDAVTAKTAAQTAKDSAETAKTAAVAAKEAAETAKTAAETARTEAETAQASAIAAKTAAETARTGAESAATSAGNSAQAAAGSASAASTAAETAGTAAGTATAKAGEASDSATAAASSASAASSSASAASGSASGAASSASAAQAWATGGSSGTPSATNNAEYWAGVAEDAAESVSASAAQIATNASDIADLENAINKFDCVPLMKHGYTGTSGTKIGNYTANESYRTCVLNVMPGDVIDLKGACTDGARVWAFADKDRVITRRADNVTINSATLTVEATEKYLVYNDANDYNPPATLYITINRIATIESIQADIDATNDLLANTITHLNTVDTISKGAKIKNNLRTDGLDNLLPFGVKIYKNGTADVANYGVSGAKYVIDIGECDKCHVRFKYRDTTFRPYSGSNVFVSIASMGKNNALNIKDLYQSITSQDGQIYRASGHYPAHRDDGTTLSLGPANRKPLNGENAIRIDYTGDEAITSASVINAVFSANSITFNINGTEAGSVSIDAEDTIQELADAINAITGFSCKIKNADGTVGDLLLLSSGTISFTNTATRGGSTVYGTKPILIPFKVDTKWHLCEFIVSRENKEAFVSYDGLTGRVGFGNANLLSDGVLVLGGSYTTESGVEISDLEIDIGTYADCELIYGHITNASNGNTRQLISDKNPRLLIFEGHGIFVGSEADAYAAYENAGLDQTSQEGMAVSTERLNIIFNELRARNYKFVTMNDVIAWKRGWKELPKRCYTMVFDDYRVENFIDYEKRDPFVKNDIKPALAMVSGLYQLTDTLTINDQSYTVSDALDIINRNGWYMCSHTKDHRNCSNYTISELSDLLKADVLSCDAHKMRGDVIVYPYGGVSTASLKAVAESDFAIGIVVVEEYYNCKASNDYRLTRTELGTRSSLENVLSPFI